MCELAVLNFQIFEVRCKSELKLEQFLIDVACCVIGCSFSTSLWIYWTREKKPTFCRLHAISVIGSVFFDYFHFFYASFVPLYTALNLENEIGVRLKSTWFVYISVFFLRLFLYYSSVTKRREQQTEIENQKNVKNRSCLPRSPYAFTI